jgi:hypothetical protein
MTGLAEFLQKPNAFAARLKLKAPEPKALMKAVKAISENDGEEPTGTDVAALQQKVVTLAEQDKLSALSRRELRECCRFFLDETLWPEGEYAVAGAVFDEVERLQRRAALFLLIDVYLDRFDSSKEEIQYLAGRLSGVMDSWPWRETDRWATCANEFDLFDPEAAPWRLAFAILESDEAITAILDAAGLTTDGRRRGGIGEEAFRAACLEIAEKSGDEATEMQVRLIEWARMDGSKNGFPGVWPAFARALFCPWQNAEPNPDHRARLIDAAVGYAGDPRVSHSRWRPVRDAARDAYAVIIRWLTKVSVELFFNIVGQSTDRPDMWAQRRRFWTAYIEADMISAAWVAFGAIGAETADEAARDSGERGFHMFGRLAAGSGRTAEHSALIMRIGDLTVVEWSHNGRWNIWRKQDANHPELFRRNSRAWIDYDPKELMGAPLWGAHQGAWQSTVRKIIRDETGLRP